LDNVDNLPRLAHYLLQSTADTGSLTGMINIGAKSGSTAGASLAAGNAQLMSDYSLPLLGVCNGADNYIPLFVSDIEFEFVVSDLIAKYVLSKSAKLPNDFLIKNVSLTYNVIELEQSVYSAMLAQYPNGIIPLLSSTYTHSGTTLLDSVGTQSIVYPHRRTSLKNVYLMVNGGNEKDLGCVNPNLAKYPELDIGGSKFPQSLVDIKNSAQAYTEIAKNFGSLYSTSHSSSLTRNNFPVAVTAGYSGTSYRTASTKTEFFASNGKASMFFMAIDLEKLSGAKSGVYNGVSSVGQSSTLTFEIANATGASLPLSVFSHFDIVLYFNVTDNSITQSS
jgi:hypothetical protein